MPRRRLSERQIKRIGKIRDRRRRRLDEPAPLTPFDAGEPQPREGLVVVRHGADLAVEDADARVHHCLARRNIGRPVCGDHVIWHPTGPGRGLVTDLLERQTVLSRPDYSGRDKPLAANLTQLVVLLAAIPEPSGYLLDQYLVAAELMGADALIAFNKVDLLDREALAAYRTGLSHYEDMGYQSVWLSVRDNRGLEPLVQRLTGESSMLVGQSGVGKSSLVKALLPDRQIQIGRLSEATGLGRHRTSAATCYRLPCGGHLIDAPGVRSFRLAAMGPNELQLGFRELAPLLGHCRFGDCRHEDEPGCSVKQALRQGRIHPERLASFQHLAAKRL